ncbi:MAG: SEC-C domain-containing protein [Elusimicrobia bacterium]|nr:SEC-C domain-containing protein [Elusimicrobiota bacterium]
MMQRVREEALEFLFRIEAAPAVPPRERVMVAVKPAAPTIEAGDGSTGTDPVVAVPAPFIRTAGNSTGPRPPLPTASAPLPEIHKIGRNDPCPCGSGKKYKKCCGK